MHDGHSDKHTLRLSHAQLGSVLVQKISVVCVARQADAFQGGLNGPVAVSACGGVVAVSAPGFPELRADSERGVERGKRTLKHETQGTSAEAAQFPFAQGEQIGAPEKNVAFDDGALAAE